MPSFHPCKENFSSMQKTIKDSLEATLVTNSKIKSLSVKT
jgi:hypothetical protein